MLNGLFGGPSKGQPSTSEINRLIDLGFTKE